MNNERQMANENLWHEYFAAKGKIDYEQAWNILHNLVAKEFEATGNAGIGAVERIIKIMEQHIASEKTRHKEIQHEAAKKSVFRPHANREQQLIDKLKNYSNKID